MDRIGLGNIGLIIKEASKNFTAYLVSLVSDDSPSYVLDFFQWVQVTVYPFIVNNSLFLMLGIGSLGFMSSAMYFSNKVVEYRSNMIELASKSRIKKNHILSSKSEIDKHENIFVFTNRKLSKENLHKELDNISEVCGLKDPHFSKTDLVNSLKLLFSYISFHDYSELELKELLLSYGWNFNIINQAFMIIENDLDNELDNKYNNMMKDEHHVVIRSIKELVMKGFGRKKLEKKLIEKGHSKAQVDKLLKTIYKIQNFHNSIERKRQKHIKKALKKNTLS